MRPINKDQIVRYVAADNTVQDARVVARVNPMTARLQLGPKITAQAVYSAKPLPGTFHFIDDEQGPANAEVNPPPASLVPGAAKTPKPAPASA